MSADATRSFDRHLLAHGLPVACLLFGITATLLLYFPGGMSADSVSQYRQIIGEAEWNDGKPQIMQHLWWLTDQVVCGPGGMLIVHVLTYWVGIGLIAFHLFRSSLARGLAVLGLGFFPPTFGLLAAIWIDVGLMSFWTLAVGLLLRLSRVQSKGLLILTGIALFYGASVRHNSIIAAVPLIYLFARLCTTRSHLRTALLTLLITLSFFGTSQLINRYETQHILMWPQIPLWDLAAISVAENQMLIPESVLIDPERTNNLESVKNAFSRISVVNMFWGEKRIVDFNMNEAVASDILGRWQEVVWLHPRAYLQHRLRTTKLLFGVGGFRGWGPYFFDTYPTDVTNHCEGGLPHRFERTPATDKLAYVLDGWVRTPLYSGWLYAVFAFGIWAASYRVRGDDAIAARWIAVSGLLYVVPLVLVAPSVEFRYMVWLVSSTLVAGPLLVVGYVRSRRA